VDTTLFTIGFAGKTAEEFFRLLEEAGIPKVLDIRENRVGQLQGFAKHPDIAFFLGRILGASYEYEPLLAPSPEIRKAYRESRDWSQYEASFKRLMAERGMPEKMGNTPFEGRVAILCSEPGPEKCHRRLVAEMLAEYWGALGHRIEVQHLVVEKPKRASKPKKIKIP
jgi:uncharacterized protein (DUF488 family)